MKELKNAGLDHFYNKIELPLINVLLNMEYEGAFVDKEMLEEMSIDLSKKVENLSTDIINEAGTEFNINSTQQLAKILFDD